MWCCPILLMLCVPKVPFRVLAKLKNKIRIISMLNRFSCWIDFYFEHLMSLFDFHFHKKIESEIQFFFHFSFSWKNWKNNYLKISRLTLRLFSQVLSTRFSRASSCQISRDFPLYNGHAGTKNLLFRKKLMYYWLLLSYLFYPYSQ